MPQPSNLGRGDFGGFLDGYQARNMAAIERGAMVQKGEISTRIETLRYLAKSEKSLEIILGGLNRIEESLNKPTDDIITKLKNFGKLFDLMLSDLSSEVLQNEKVDKQLKGIVFSFASMVQNCHTDDLVELALTIGKTYNDLKAKQ